MKQEDLPGNTIKALRQAQELSQEGLARILGVSVRTVARWEGGASQPSSLAIERLRQVMMAYIEPGTNNG